MPWIPLNHRFLFRRLISPLLVAVCARAQANTLDTLQSLRTSTCPTAAHSPFHHSAPLDIAAQRWARGDSLDAALNYAHYVEQSTAALHVTGTTRSAAASLRDSSCTALTRADLRDIGLYERGSDTWIVLADPYTLPRRDESAGIAAQVLSLVNAARAHPQRCGTRAFAPTTPLRRSSILDRVARGHAIDMAEHHYLDHIDFAHHSPADRLRAAGYRESLVGENIAYGPNTAEDVVKGWLASPSHCENLMTVRFTEMGIAYAQGQSAITERSIGYSSWQSHSPNCCDRSH